MVRSYRKYEAGQVFGTICTATSNCIWSPAGSSRNSGAGKVYVGANEDVLCWDVKKGELLARWHDKDCKSAVTCISQCGPQPDLFAIGYADGSIRIWDALLGTIVVVFNGHRSAISQLIFDSEGSRLASGSKDTDIIVWNTLSETAEFRLRGHKDQITGLSFIQTPTSHAQDDTADNDEGYVTSEVEERYLLSTSKDALVKIWELSAPHCVETHVAQSSGECWALGVSPDGSGCVTAGNDGEVRIWNLDTFILADLQKNIGEGRKQDALQSKGTLQRQSKERPTSIQFHPKQDYIAIHGSEKAVELWRIRPSDEIHRHMQRKRRRRREKAAAAGEILEAEGEDSVETPEVSDVFVPYVIVRTGGKVRSIQWGSASGGSSKQLHLLAATTNNQIEMYNMPSYQAMQKLGKKEAPEYTRSLALELPGHRTDVRSLSLSSDDRMLASASAGSLKIWSVKTQSCLRTLECGQALCSAFLPGDRMVVIGTKSGELELYDISTSNLIEKIQAHDGAVWTLAVHPDGRSVVTGSADKSAKFWRFDIVDEEIPGTRRTTQRLKLSQTRQLKVSDEVLSVCFSPDQRLLALSTLDFTVKVFFVDSLKLFLTLYGHKLPVLNISISSDSKLIGTCSADKNVRVWGLDFGDCHKAFFAHQDSVMQVGFIPHPVEHDEKHIIFSASKDGTLKTWDGDKFEQIQRLGGHHGEIWAMAVSRTGETVVTASHDKSIRVWNVGDDLVFLEEERERELEEMYENTLAQNLDRDYQADVEMEDQDAEVAAASKQTVATLTHGEKIMEALEVGVADLEIMREYANDKARNPKVAPPSRNPLFMALGGISAEQHVLNTLRKIPRASLNDALLVIPLTTLPSLFTFLSLFMHQRLQPELAWTITYFLLQTHQAQIIASRQLKDVLTDIYHAYEQWETEEKQVLGFNLAGLTILGREAKDNVNSAYIDENLAEEGEDLAKGRKKRAFANLS